ncbi:hypothetical protein llap_20385 [Limosa lapponica baueri]|uniref:Uncharacterized protein n=1 Tax=Limosa lapponica baueri TaxID=1758121 RepID=A0A2I0T689_LIMLA|nr:hypothetical protein llap_20385 [Limosa lapponica baueri]
MMLSVGAGKLSPDLPHVDARNIDGSTPLCDACASGSIECVKVLLSHGAKVNPPLYTASPLHEACMNGANVNAAKLHETALHHAAKVKNVDLVEMLIEFGGNIYARDNRGKKPSDYTWSSSPTAKCFEYYESIEFLVGNTGQLAVGWLCLMVVE